MATLCPRCRSEASLVTIGVFRCATCGTVDPDGNAVSVPEDAERAATTFAPPPPPSASPMEPTSADPPRMLMIACGIEVVACLVESASTANWCALTLELACLVPVVSGRPWARVLALVGAVIGLLLYTARLIFGWGHLGVGEFFGIVAILIGDAFWIFALQHTDTVAYFEKRGALTDRRARSTTK